MLGNFKKLIAVGCLMAASVISTSAFADHDHGGYNDGYQNDRWVCSVNSRGYDFRAEGRSYDEANYNVVTMCMNSYAASPECRINIQCQQLNNGGGNYPQPQPYPQPYPQRVYTCQTYGGGRWYAGRSPSLVQAQRRAVMQCQSNPWARPRECQRNLQCGY